MDTPKYYRGYYEGQLKSALFYHDHTKSGEPLFAIAREADADINRLQEQYDELFQLYQELQA